MDVPADGRSRRLTEKTIGHAAPTPWHTRPGWAALVVGFMVWHGGALLRPMDEAAQAAVVTTDKPDYFPGETVIVTGAGFATSTQVPIIRPDGSIVKGDGTGTPSWDSRTLPHRPHVFDMEQPAKRSSPGGDS